jgi:hypothetical protein
VKQFKRQGLQVILAGDGEDLEERRHGPDPFALLERHFLRHTLLADLAGCLVDDQGGRDDDLAEAQRVLGVVFDRVVVKRLCCGAQPSDGEGRQDAKSPDCHGEGPSIEPRPPRMLSAQARASLSMAKSARR